MEMRTCRQCGNEFDLHSRIDAEVSKNLCSFKCHNKYYRDKRKASKLSGDDDMSDEPDHEQKKPLSVKPSPAYQAGTPTFKELAPVMSQGISFNDLPPAARFIIATLQAENSELKTDKRELSSKVETLKEERDSLKNEMREIRKPSTLEGLAESPMLKELIPHIGPALGNLINSMVNGKAMPVAGAVNGGEQLPEETNQMVSGMIGWFIGLQPELQKEFFGIVNGLAEKSPEDLHTMLGQLSNLVLKNSSFQYHYGT